MRKWITIISIKLPGGLKGITIPMIKIIIPFSFSFFKTNKNKKMKVFEFIKNIFFKSKKSKSPIVVFTQPIDQYFTWQVHLYIENCISVGFLPERIHVLLYNPAGRPPNKNWEKLAKLYPKVKFYNYPDRGAKPYLGLYIPVLRPHILWQHFEANPWLKNETILYTDCDILWMRTEGLKKLYEDDCCYVSDAKSYLNVSYFDNKTKDVLPDKLEEYKKRDVVQELCDIVGVEKNIVVDNNNNTGGVQYILKNVDAEFWKKIETDVISIRKHLLAVNKEFFESENKGIQSWCADLWALQYNLWRRGCCKTAPELEFAWVHDPISKLEKVNIYHNAGATNTHTVMGKDKDGNEIKYPVFYKGKYHQGNNPFKDEHLDDVLTHEETKKHCTWYYASKLDELRRKYKIDYF